MERGEYIWKDGKIIPWDDDRAKVHVSNHSFNYGSPVYEGIRFYEIPKNKKGDSAVFRLEDHVNRLFHSASVMGNDLGGYSKKEISDAIVETVKVNKFKEGYIRPIIYFGDGIGIDIGNKSGEVAIMAFSWERYLEGEGVRVCVTSLRKLHPRTTDTNAKISGTYFNSVLAHKEAREKGYDECLMLSCKNAQIAEGSGENIFFVKGKKLITPLGGDFLSGVTRETILTLGKENGLEVKERIVHPCEIHNMDEAFFCGTAVEITPISEIKESEKTKKYETHEITNQIREIYMSTVQGKNDHLEWLTFV